MSYLEARNVSWSGLLSLVLLLILHLLLLCLIRGLLFVHEVQSLNRLEVLILFNLNGGSHMGDKTLLLLGCWPDDLLLNLCGVLTDILATLVCLVTALSSSPNVTLHDLEQCLVRIEHHLVLLDVYILWGHSMLSQLSSNQDAEAILSDHILLYTLWQRKRQSTS